MHTKKLIIRNLDSSASAAEIENFLSIFGDVGKIKINRRKGMGYIEMTSISEAKRACANLDGKILWGRSIKICNIKNSLRDRLAFRFGKIFP